MATTTGRNSGWNGWQEHSSCLWFQMLGVEVHSFRQTETNVMAAIFAAPKSDAPSPARIPPIQRIRKLLERYRLRRGHGGNALE